MSIRRRLRWVFYAEIIINLISSGLYLFVGQQAVAALGVVDPAPIVIEAFRWFAVLTLVITYIMARVLQSNDESTLRIVLEGYLLGDIIYLMVLLQFVNVLGGIWSIGSLFAAIITIVFICVRIAYLTLREK